MKFEAGQSFMFHRFNNYDKPELVTVVALHRGGCAKLSNGWVVDEDGRAEGTGRQPGGYVESVGDSKP